MGKPQALPPAVADLDNFAEQILRIKGLYGWQRRAMSDLSPPGARVAVKAANGSGKTVMLSAPAAIHNAIVNPGSLTVTTSGVYRQVKEQMWPAIRQHSRRFANLGLSINQTDLTLGESRIIGFSTDDPGRFEGWHNDHLLLVLDEAKTIRSEIFQAAERCQPERMLVISSPGGCSGEFWNIFDKRLPGYKLHTVTAHDCPHIPQTWIDEQIARWGKDHPLIRSMIYGEFMLMSDEQLVIPWESLKRCLEHKARPKGDEIAVGCDFGGGGDENVICWRRGNNVQPLIAWTDRNTMSAVGRFITEFRRLGVEPHQIYGDASGLGQPMIDALQEAGWPINRVFFGARAGAPEKYKNRVAEMWFTAARLIEMFDISVPEDESLHGQLTNRRCRVTGGGQLMLESKDEMKLRGLSSPDRADAFVMCVSNSRMHNDLTMGYIRPTLEEMFGNLNDDQVLAGCEVGN